MSKTHWKKLNNPDYLGAYALEPGEDLILTILKAGEETYTGNSGKKETGLLIHFEENDAKPMICNATNAKTITKVMGSPYIEDWKGRKIQLYAAEVNAFGETVEALRVRPFAPKQDQYFCQDCGIEIVQNGQYSARAIAQSSKSKFGKALCMDCAKKAKEEQEKKDKEGDILGDENNED